MFVLVCVFGIKLMRGKNLAVRKIFQKEERVKRETKEDEAAA